MQKAGLQITKPNNFKNAVNNNYWVKTMVILFSDRKSKTEKEIIDILTFIGADYISDKTVCSFEGAFTIVSEYKKTELKLNHAIAIFCENTDRFDFQLFPKGVIGICEETNIKALEVFHKNKIPVISCGMGNKNTVTFSSFSGDTLLMGLQRSITSIKGLQITPGEYKITLKKQYSPFAIMASATVLLLNGIIPKEF